MRLTRATIAAASAFAFAGLALAQDDVGSEQLLGAWRFEAAPTYDGCSLSGDLFIRQGATSDSFLCEMVANDACPGVWEYQAEQNCTATRDGDTLTIESRIVSVEPPTDRYLPDNFELRIVDGSLMLGELRSAMIASARFYRTDGPIS